MATYKSGDRLYYQNAYNQGFYANIVRKIGNILIVKRDEWPTEECIDMDNNPYVRIKHFPKTVKG